MSQRNLPMDSCSLSASFVHHGEHGEFPQVPIPPRACGQPGFGNGPQIVDSPESGFPDVAEFFLGTTFRQEQRFGRKFLNLRYPSVIGVAQVARTT